MLLILPLLAAAEVDVRVQGVANFADERAYLRRGVDPFESLNWTKRPSPTRLRRAFPETPPKWLYAHVRCRRFTRTGRLKKCAVMDADGNAATRLVSRRALPLMRHFAISPSDAKRLNQKIESIWVDLQFQFAGVRNEGECWTHGFCIAEPPPPPPPPG